MELDGVPLTVRCVNLGDVFAEFLPEGLLVALVLEPRSFGPSLVVIIEILELHPRRTVDRNFGELDQVLRNVGRHVVELADPPGNTFVVALRDVEDVGT